MHWIGWGSSALLLTTIIYQVRRHWRSRDNGSVSRLLYFGQTGASLGFMVYSIGVGDWVFTTTNAVLALAGFCGIYIHHHHESHARAAR